MIPETVTEILVVNYSVPCGTYWIGGSTDINITVTLPQAAQFFFKYSQYIPNDSGISKQ